MVHFKSKKWNCVIKFSTCKLKIPIMDNNTSVNISDLQMAASTEELVDCTWTWWSSDGCFYIGTCSCTWTHLLVQMNTLRPPFRWIPRQRDSLRTLNVVLCLLWMPQQMDMLLHTDRTRILCYAYVTFAMDASTNGLVVAHGHC